MKDTKHKFSFFAVYDTCGMAEHFEKMAAKGWMIEDIGTVMYRYRRIEPVQLKFSVISVSKASDFAAVDEGQSEFYEMCRAAGWELVTKSDRMHVFAKRDTNVPPMETDPVTQVENIHSSYGKVTIWGYGLLALLWLVNAKGNLDTFFAWPEIFFTAGAWHSMWNNILIAFVFAVSAADYLLWYRKAVKLASQENRFYHKKTGLLFIVLRYGAIAAIMINMAHRYNIVFFIIMLAAVAAAGISYTWMKSALKDDKGSAKENEILVGVFVAAIMIGRCWLGMWSIEKMDINIDRDSDRIVAEEQMRNGDYEYTRYIYADDMPLTVEDLTDTDYDNYSYLWNRYVNLPWLKVYTGSQDANPNDDAPEIYYTVYFTAIDGIYSAIEREEAEYHKFAATEMPQWQTDRVYISGISAHDYMLCYENVIIRIKLPAEPTDRQIATIKEKLDIF